MLLSLLAPAAALVPAMYALYLNRYSQALLCVVVSGTGLACALSDIFSLGLGSGGGEGWGGAWGGAESTDAALTLVTALVAVVRLLAWQEAWTSAVQIGLVVAGSLCAAWLPGVLVAPVSSGMVALVVLPAALWARRQEREEDGVHSPVPRAAGPRGEDRVSVSMATAGAGVVLAAAGVQACQTNSNFMTMHSCWRVLMYLATLMLLASARDLRERAGGNTEGGKDANAFDGNLNFDESKDQFRKYLEKHI